MSAISARPGGLVGPTSVTIIRTDPLSSLPPGLSTAERVARFSKAIALLTVVDPFSKNPDKWRADVATGQRHAERYVATQHPVEQGVDITDHVRRLPDTFDFTGLIVDTPFIPFGIAGATPLQGNRAQQQLQRLRDLADEREPLFIATSTKIYESMILLFVGWVRMPDSGSSIPVTIKAQQVQIRSDVVGDKLVEETVAELGARPLVDGGASVPQV